MSYTEIAQRNKANAEKAQKLDQLDQQEAMRRTVDAHIQNERSRVAQEREAQIAWEMDNMNPQLQRHQLMADEQAVANRAPLSDSPYAVAARQWKPPAQQPSVLDEVTSYLGQVADGASTWWDSTKDRLSQEPVDPHAELKRAVQQEQEQYEMQQAINNIPASATEAEINKILSERGFN